MELEQFFKDNASAMPEELKHLCKSILEGRVAQFALAVEYADGRIATQWSFLEPGENAYTMLGILEVLKRDYMRAEIEGRIEYVRQE